MAFGNPNVKWDYLEALKTWVPMLFSGAVQWAGVPAPVAEQLKEALTGFLEGTSIQDEESYQQFQQGWQTGLPGLLEAHKVLLAPYLAEMLKTVFEPKAYLEILSSEDPEAALEQSMRLACLRDKSASLWKLGEDAIRGMAASMVTASMEQIEGDPEFLRAVQDKQWFARHFKKAPHTANADYALSFAAPLFLHKDSPDGWRVSLRNLYVMPQYKLLEKQADEEDAEPQDDLEARLAAFVAGDIPFLLIEGDAGTGKTTLAAWLNFHDVLGDKPQLFGSRPLVTVRLRDLDSEILRQKGFNQALLDYTQCRSFNEWPKNAILLLDGYDELCMIEQGSADPAGFLKNLKTFTSRGFRVIVTSRHTYIPEKLPLRAVRLSLQHFDTDKRSQWMAQYTAPKYCGQTLHDKVRAYIARIDDNTVSCVCDTPMTLYMLAAGSDNEKYLNNDWELYHHIFMNALSETQYNEMIPNPTWDYQHHVADLKEVLYRISEEIAFAMFQTGNAAFTLNDTELAEIVTRLKPDYPILQDAHMEQVARHCYGLCCYWKTGGQKGAVEFLHNTIRDFFLAEYLCRKLDETAKTMQANGETECTRLTDLLARHLWYAPLEPNVLYFAYHRVCHHKQQGTPDYASWEASDHKIKAVLDDLSEEGILRNATGFLDEKKAKGEKCNLHECTLNVVKNTMLLYRVAYEPYLKDGELIRWCDWKRGNNDLVYALFAEIFSQDPFCRHIPYEKTKSGIFPFGLGSRGDYTSKILSQFAQAVGDLKLWNRMLPFVNLHGSNLHLVSLERAFIEAADLSETHLTEAYLSNADLNGATLAGADLTGAELPGANLTDADLTDANLHGANLIGATLPDGFQRNKQKEQIRHLMGMNIEGLQLDDPDSDDVSLIQMRCDAKHPPKN